MILKKKFVFEFEYKGIICLYVEIYVFYFGKLLRWKKNYLFFNLILEWLRGFIVNYLKIKI